MSDIVFEASEQITVLCNNLNVQGHDFLLDSPQRRKPNGPQFRRALVHDQGDGLTLNFAGDYPGGVTIGSGLTVTGDVKFTIISHAILVTGQRVPPEHAALGEVILTLRGEIAALQARVTALEAGH